MSFTNFGKIAESKNQVIRLTHVATGTSVSFAAFLTEFSDDYQVSWGTEQIFGRNDPIKPYQSTTRSISIAFQVLAPSFEAARENLQKYSTLTKMLYPVYSAPIGANPNSRTIKGPPLIRIKFVNFIQAASGEGSLLGCIEGFKFAPVQDAGYFVEQNGDLFPKHFDVSFRFTPQHESPLGWDSQTERFLTDAFPYSSAPSQIEANEPSGTNSSKQQAKNDRALD